MSTTIAWQIAELIAKQTHLTISDLSRPTQEINIALCGDNPEHCITISQQTDRKGKTTITLQTAKMTGAPYNAYAPSMEWMIGAWTPESIVADFLYRYWEDHVLRYWIAGDAAQRGARQYYEDICRLAEELALIGAGQTRYPLFRPSNDNTIHAITAKGEQWRIERFSSTKGYRHVLTVAVTDAQARAIVALMTEESNPP